MAHGGVSWGLAVTLEFLSLAIFGLGGASVSVEGGFYGLGGGHENISIG